MTNGQVVKSIRKREAVVWRPLCHRSQPFLVAHTCDRTAESHPTLVNWNLHIRVCRWWYRSYTFVCNWRQSISVYEFSLPTQLPTRFDLSLSFFLFLILYYWHTFQSCPRSQMKIYIWKINLNSLWMLVSSSFYRNEYVFLLHSDAFQFQLVFISTEIVPFISC